MRHNLPKGLIIFGSIAAAGGLVACDVHVREPHAVVRTDVAVVDVNPGDFESYYDAPYAAGGFYVYRVDGGFHYLDRYHAGPHGERIFERTYRVRRNLVHRDFRAHEHEMRERPR